MEMKIFGREIFEGEWCLTIDVGRMNARMGIGLTNATNVEMRAIRKEIAEESLLLQLLKG